MIKHHPDVLKVYPDCKTYRNLTQSGAIIEAYDKMPNGQWRDVTLREQELYRLKQEIKKAQKELDTMEVPNNENKDN